MIYCPNTHRYIGMHTHADTQTCLKKYLASCRPRYQLFNVVHIFTQMVQSSLSATYIRSCTTYGRDSLMSWRPDTFYNPRIDVTEEGFWCEISAYKTNRFLEIFYREIVDALYYFYVLYIYYWDAYF